MNEPKYKIGQEVYKIELGKPKSGCVIAHQISEIRLRTNDEPRYTMYVHGYRCGEDYCDAHSYDESDLFETIDEAQKQWENKNHEFLIEKAKKEFDRMKDNLPYKEGNVGRAKKDLEEAKNAIEIQKQKVELLISQRP